MSLLNDIGADLNEKRLWPVVALLSAGVVGIPMAASLTSPSSPVPGAAPAAMTPVAGAGAVLPGLPGHAPARRPVSTLEHDPFSATSARAATSSATGTASAAGAAAGTAAAGTPSATAHSTAPAPSAGAASGGSAPSLSTPSGPVPSFSSPAAPKLTPVPNLPTPKGLPLPNGVPSPRTGSKGSGGHHASPRVVGPDQTRYFAVSMRFGAATGGSVLTNPPRLQVLPSTQDPVAQYLGVREDGRSALFLLNPAVSASGDGYCSPNPRSCQLITLRAGESEFLDAHSSTRGTVQYELDVLSVSPRHSSATVAGKARRRESPAGRRMLGTSKASALRGLLYSQDLGVVIGRAAHSAKTAGVHAATTGTVTQAAGPRTTSPAPYAIPSSPAAVPAPSPPASSLPVAPAAILPVVPGPTIAPDPAAEMALSLRASWSQASGWMFSR